MQQPHHHKWKYKNLTFFFVSILCAVVLSQIPEFHDILISLGSFGYFSAFFAGMMLASTFTVATGVLMIVYLTETLSALEIGIIAGLGSVFCDLIIFEFMRNNLAHELVDVYHALGGHHVSRILKVKYFAWTLPVIGALILISPLPDELGVSLMGISKMRTLQFLIVSFILNFIGIFLIVSATTLV